MKSIYDSLAGCPENITKYCDTDFPALPMMDNCTESTTAFKVEVLSSSNNLIICIFIFSRKLYRNVLVKQGKSKMNNACVGKEQT